MAPLLDTLREHAERAPDAVALIAPDGTPTTYESLVGQIEGLAHVLRGCGVGPTDRVAVAVPNGRDLAITNLAVISAAACAPFAVEQPAAEFERQLGRIGARALIVAPGHGAAAREAATTLDVPVLELRSDGPDERSPERTLTIDSATREPSRAPSGGRHTSEAALLLFTSGTTSAPKLVPITEEALVLSARNVATTLELDPRDRGLNVMPLFHIHGLVAALLAPLVSGGSVVCTRGFAAPELPEWFDRLSPSWYTAVPTIHRAMLDAARAYAGSGQPLRPSFRVIRSSSAALPRRLLDQLEATFDVPVIEAYGMTEAAHQMTSNPLHNTRKPGSVGCAAGPEVVVLDDLGEQLPAGAVGEIAIRGSTVTAGYLDDPEVNAAAFTNGWFRTGDQGRFDPDGFLTITGRLKEIINRGGEKVTPPRGR